MIKAFLAFIVIASSVYLIALAIPSLKPKAVLIALGIATLTLAILGSIVILF